MVHVKDMKSHENKGYEKGLSLIFKQGTKKYIRNSKKKHKNYKQEQKMSKINMKTNIYYANICKHEHENNMTRLWCKIVLKTSVE
jgi:hypothetical protein